MDRRLIVALTEQEVNPDRSLENHLREFVIDTLVECLDLDRDIEIFYMDKYNYVVVEEDGVSVESKVNGDSDGVFASDDEYVVIVTDDKNKITFKNAEAQKRCSVLVCRYNLDSVLRNMALSRISPDLTKTVTKLLANDGGLPVLTALQVAIKKLDSVPGGNADNIDVFLTNVIDAVIEHEGNKVKFDKFLDILKEYWDAPLPFFTSNKPNGIELGEALYKMFVNSTSYRPNSDEEDCEVDGLESPKAFAAQPVYQRLGEGYVVHYPKDNTAKTVVKALVSCTQGLLPKELAAAEFARAGLNDKEIDELFVIVRTFLHNKH